MVLVHVLSHFVGGDVGGDKDHLKEGATLLQLGVEGGEDGEERRAGRTPRGGEEERHELLIEDVVDAQADALTSSIHQHPLV